MLKYSSLNNYCTQVKISQLNKFKSESNLRNDKSPRIFLAPTLSDGELPQQIKSTVWKILYKQPGIYLKKCLPFNGRHFHCFYVVVKILLIQIGDLRNSLLIGWSISTFMQKLKFVTLEIMS